MPLDFGPVYTKGASFRARAEARQRQYRVDRLECGYSTWGHWLEGAAADAGANFVTTAAHNAALSRRGRGKGVADRTFTNMLSSQAMCFNVFTPLAQDTELAARVLGAFVPGLAGVTAIHFEYTPPNDVFGDQSGRSGVDCDLLIQGTAVDGQPAVVVIETKFVEPEFSVCGYRREERRRQGNLTCPESLLLESDAANCLYTSRKGYRYWQRSREVGNVRDGVLGGPCPFGGPLWQLWVNHTLAGVEASRRGAARAVFGVCAPVGNKTLLDDGRHIEQFRSCLADPSTLCFIPLDQLIRTLAQKARDDLRACCEELIERYVAI